MSKINLNTAPRRIGSGYPPPFDERCKLRERLQLGDAVGLTQFGVNLLRLAPGQWSSQRHWHTAEDEFVYVVAGQVVLVCDQGEFIMGAGECAGFVAGATNGHHLQNRASVDALLLEIGSRRPDADAAHYPDVDLFYPESGKDFTHKDRTPY